LRLVEERRRRQANYYLGTVLCAIKYLLPLSTMDEVIPYPLLDPESGLEWRIPLTKAESLVYDLGKLCHRLRLGRVLFAFLL